MNKAQAKFIADDFLKRFSNRYTVVDASSLPILEQILIQSGLEFNKLVVENLEKDGSISTGGLTDIGIPQAFQISDKVVLEVGYPLDSKQVKYYDYLNKGVAGYGGANANLKKNAGLYKFKNPFPNRSMASAIYGWLNRARKSITADTVDLSKTQKKRRKLAKMLSESENKRRLAYAISTKIKRDGLKATYFFDKAFNKVFNKEFQESLEVALQGEVTIQIKNIYGNNPTK